MFNFPSFLIFLFPHPRFCKEALDNVKWVMHRVCWKSHIGCVGSPPSEAFQSRFFHRRSVVGCGKQRMVKGSWQTYIHMEYIKHIPVAPLGFPNSLNLCIWLTWFYDLLLLLLLCFWCSFSFIMSLSAHTICFFNVLQLSNSWKQCAFHPLFIYPSAFPLLAAVPSAESQHICVVMDSCAVL